jgi:hypothetical protein
MGQSRYFGSTSSFDPYQLKEVQAPPPLDHKDSRRLSQSGLGDDALCSFGNRWPGEPAKRLGSDNSLTHFMSSSRWLPSLKFFKPASPAEDPVAQVPKAFS